MTKKTQKPQPAEVGTTQKQHGGVTGKGFTKADPRINRKGRPKNFDQLRALAQKVAAENLGESGLTRIEAMMIAMSTSRNPRDRELFLQYAFGKVKDELAVTAKVDRIEAYNYGDALAAIAPRPVDDSDAPGEDKDRGDGAAVGQDSDGG